MLEILAGVIGFVGHRLDHSPKIIKMAMKAEMMSSFLQSMQYLRLLTFAASEKERTVSPTDFNAAPKGTANLLNREFYTFFASFARSNILVLLFLRLSFHYLSNPILFTLQKQLKEITEWY